ncbi:unnamed protein product [Urochloa humidicola]
MVPKEKLLLPTPPGEDECKLILLVQVTAFACGGFVVGYRSSHAIADGAGAAQFMAAVGELARGAGSLSVPPQWSRGLMPEPSSTTTVTSLPNPDPSGATRRLEYLAVDVSAEQIARLKSQYDTAAFASSGRCSTFEVAIAMAWRSRTRAAGFAEDAVVTLCFAMSTRALVKSSLPRGGAGFYGNCYYIMRVSAAAGEVAQSSVAEVVRMIKDGKRRMPAEFARWVTGEMEEDDDPYRVTADYRTLLVSDWTRLGFTEVDYGWGPPAHVAPLASLSHVATCVLVRPRATSKPGGARLITQCVTADRVDEFRQGMLLDALTA